MAQSIPNFSNLLCPACSCPLSQSQSHLQQPPFPPPPSSATKNNIAMKENEDTGAPSTGTLVSSPNVDPTLNFSQPTPPEAPSFPAPAPSPVPSPSTSAPAPNQALNAAPAPAIASAPPPSASDFASSSSNPNPSRPLQMAMHKNRLQEYAQRSSLPLPEYRTVNEGSPHAPLFRSSVTVDGRIYTSVSTFAHRKAAEQDAARLCLEGISKNIEEQGSSLVSRILWQDTVFCKSILNEFATKMELPKPTYSTVQLQVLIPDFVSSVVLNEKSYTGDHGKNKKEAERLAARAAIISLMGDSGFGTVLHEIIKSKGKMFDALFKVKDLNPAHNSLAQEGVNANAGSGLGISHNPALGVEAYVPQQISAIQNPFMPVMSQQAAQAASVPAPSPQVSAIPAAHTTLHPPHHEFKMPKQEISPSVSTPPTGFVPPVQQPFIAFVPPAQQHQFTGLVPNLGKRKNRKNKKPNKKARAGVQ